MDLSIISPCGNSAEYCSFEASFDMRSVNENANEGEPLLTF